MKKAFLITLLVVLSFMFGAFAFAEGMKTIRVPPPYDKQFAPIQVPELAPDINLFNAMPVQAIDVGNNRELLVCAIRNEEGTVSGYVLVYRVGPQAETIYVLAIIAKYEASGVIDVYEDTSFFVNGKPSLVLKRVKEPSDLTLIINMLKQTGI